MEWRVVENYPAYLVSNQGKILCSKTGNYVFPTRNMAGFLTVQLCRYGKPTTMFLHRVVANAFVDNPTGHPFVRHMDGDKLNNKAANLIWSNFEGFYHDEEDDEFDADRFADNLEDLLTS